MDSNSVSRMYKEVKKNGPTIWSIDVDGSTEILIGDQYKLELSAFDSLNYFGESVVVCSLVASAVVGSYYKSAIYQYMYRTMKDNGPTPIDLLILVNTITQHLVCLILVATYTIGLTLDFTLSHYLGQAWCNVPWYAGIYSVSYRTFGSLGIAVYRLLLIKRQYWLDLFGKRKMVFIILALSVFISAGLSIGVGTGNGPASRKQVTWNWCVGYNEVFREIEHEYSLITGTVTSEPEELAKICILGGLVGTFMELSCYLVFFSHLNSHDKGLFSRNILK